MKNSAKDEAPKVDAKEAAILEKMRAGLSRAQAEEVLAAQAAHDAAAAKAAAKAK